MVKPATASALERLGQLRAQLLIDQSNPSAGIRIVLKGPPVVRRQAQAEEEAEAEDRLYKSDAFSASSLSRPRFTFRERPPQLDFLDDEIRKLEYVIVDLETTGGAPSRGHRVTEFGAVRMRGDGQIIGEYETLINPERYIPPLITALTNITPEMAANAPRFADVAEEIRDFIHGAVFVAHNAQFDRRFLGMELARAGLPLYGRTLCTVRLARQTVREVQSRSLDSLSYFFGVENYARHRAMGDAKATALIFRKLLDRLDDHEVTRWTELEAFLRRRKKKKKKRIASPQPMEDA